MGDRIRICRIKKVGRRQQFFSTESKLLSKIDMLRLRQQENDKKQTRREELSRKYKRKRWIVTSKKVNGRKVKKHRISKKKIFKGAWEQAVLENVVSGGVMQVILVLRGAYMKGTKQSDWGRELRWLEDQQLKIVEYYVWSVEEYKKRVEHREEKIQELTKIVARGAQRQKISWEIDVIIHQEVINEKGNSKTFTLGNRLQESKKRKVKRREEGPRRIVTRGDGLVWIVQQEVPDDITWRKEKRRRELMERREAPPLGPPGKG